MDAALVGPILRGPGDPVRGIAPERDEVGHLLRLDPVALAHLRRADALELADAPARQQDRHGLACELKGVAIARDGERAPAALGLDARPGGHEIVRLLP